MKMVILAGGVFDVVSGGVVFSIVGAILCWAKSVNFIIIFITALIDEVDICT